MGMPKSTSNLTCIVPDARGSPRGTLPDEVVPDPPPRTSSLCHSSTSSNGSLPRGTTPDRSSRLVKFDHGSPVPVSSLAGLELRGTSLSEMVPRASTFYRCRCLPTLLPNPGHSWAPCPEVTRHNRLHDRFADFCCRACLAPECERGCRLTYKKDRSRAGDVLVPNWSLSRSAAFDQKVINPLNSNFLLGASMTSGYTAELRKQDKHSKNNIPCTERGWVCVMEVFGG